MFPDHSNGAQRQNRSSVTLHNLRHASSKGYHKIESNKITLFRKVRLQLQIVVLLKIGLVRKMLRFTELLQKVPSSVDILSG